MALREILANLQIRVQGAEQLRQTNQGISSAVGGLRQAATQLRGVGTQLAAALALRQVVRFTTDLIDAGDELDKMSQSLGLSVEALQRWQFIAERSGVSAQQLSGALLRLTRSAGAAAEGAAGPAGAYRELGVSVRDANGELRQGEDLFEATILGLAGVENATQRSFIATQIFGRTGASLLPIVNGGAEGIAELTARFHELGGAMSGEAVAAAAEAQDALADFDLVATSLKGKLAVAFLPTLTRVINALSDFATEVADVLEHSSAFETGLVVLIATLGGVAVALGIVLAEYLAIVIPILLLILLIGDLITLFRGGQSVVGDFIDEMFGVGAAQTTVEALTAAWENLVLVVRDGLALLRGEDAPSGGGQAEQVSAEEGRRRAALRGEVRGVRGQSFEEALAAANEARAAEGLEALPAVRSEAPPEVTAPDAEAPRARGRARPPPRGPTIPREIAAEVGRDRRTVGAAAAPRGATTTIVQNVEAPVTINVEGARDTEVVAASVRRGTDRTLARIFSNAAATLPQGT